MTCDESTVAKTPVFYYMKFPENIDKKQRIFILDPMLATGGSVMLCISKLLELGVKQENITFINLISCPEGIASLTAKYPEVQVITAVIDESLNKDRYILPGLGDFGDRYFGNAVMKTKI